ncbi:shikimate dehydrogenase [Trichlorobacter ammonificans]|uniref:shikimate dehydrogenase n=1 Tax=Trichlorobacter ammonificans TaxID=2916410 RepID=UPI002737F244|nr:shikimate dehydrogenase [Trichlorobacter ammonificans]
MTLTGASAVYGIIGWPVRHSLSPVMQNAAFQAAGIDAVFVPFAVAPERLAAALEGMRALQVAGFNVTIPHKTAIMPLLDELDPAARAAGAVNVVKNQNGRLVGFNTDGAGLVRSLERDLGCPPAGRRIVLVGAGGAARGALAALCRAGAAEVSVLNRTAAAAREMIALIGSESVATACSVLDPDAVAADFWQTRDLIVNATSLGMHGEEIAGLALACLPPAARVYDMVYSPPETPLLAAAAAQGLATANGLGMLVAQGELAFALWTGTPAPENVMRDALSRYRDRT